MAATHRERHAALVQQQQDLADRRDALIAEHASALINGKAFDKQQQISDINHEIEALDLAITALDGQATKEENRARASLQADSLQRKIDEIVADEESYFEDVAQAEDLLLAFVEKLKGAHAKADRLRQVFAEVPGVTSNAMGLLPEFDNGNISARLSQKMGLLFSRIIARGSYGIFRWADEHDRDVDFAAEERQALAGITRHAVKLISERISALRAQAAA
ncbi:hypothetical protein [Rhizobium tropici]|uniref:Uncharacterized protein n=1 Tax=Rhizobium tropici TaxID=398 RepID=A0A329YCT7_RHITR|nr:hypothetical protein [Rhizobium tropici]RAX40748.1 hypothetical protein DQ393_15365 [Rhizobium tropici]